MADYEFEQSKRSSAESKNGASRMTLTLNVRVRKDELGRKVIEVAADGHAEAYDKGWINESRHRSAQFFFDVQITRKREIGSDYILRKVVMVEVDDTGHVHASYQCAVPDGLYYVGAWHINKTGGHLKMDGMDASTVFIPEVMLPVVITGSSVPGFSKNWDRLKIGLMSLDDATGVVAEEIGKPESERDQRFLDLAETYFPGIEQQVREQLASQGALA